MPSTPLFLDAGPLDLVLPILWILGTGCALVAGVALWKSWLSARAGLHRWRSFRNASQPVSATSRAKAISLIIPAGLFTLSIGFALASAVWLSVYRGRQWQQLANRERKQKQESEASEAAFQHLYRKKRQEQSDSAAWHTAAAAAAPSDTSSTKPEQDR